MKIRVFGYYGESFISELIIGEIGSKIIVYEYPDTFSFIGIHNNLSDNSVICEVKQQKKYGPSKKGHGGKIKRW